MATITEPKPEIATLNNDEILRYSRHLIMPEVGMEGQQKLKAARVLCIGAGGLGSPLTLYLTAAGVGTLGIVDFDPGMGFGGFVLHSGVVAGLGGWDRMAHGFVLRVLRCERKVNRQDATGVFSVGSFCKNRGGRTRGHGGHGAEERGRGSAFPRALLGVFVCPWRMLVSP